MKWIIPALLLSGCAPSLGQTSASGGIVNSYGWQPNRALAEAQKHCAEYGKDAVVQDTNDLQDKLSFRCVSR
jgi:hypothetical protein